MPPLTPRQLLFVDAYLVTRNASQAARDAGYSPGRAAMTGSELLQKPHIVAALRARGLEPPRGVHPGTQIRQRCTKRPRTGLSLYEERFALAYLVCANASEAARRAGIKTSTPHIAGAKLLHRPRIAAFIEAERAASIERTRIDVDRVKREYARLAFVDIGDIAAWDEDGFALKASAAISPDDRAAIAQVKLASGAKGVKASIKLHSKQRALDSLAKLMGLFGKTPFVTIDHEKEKRDANAILRERLMRIVRSGDDQDQKEPAGTPPVATKKAE
jgi:phage terminase small subunit